MSRLSRRTVQYMHAVLLKLGQSTMLLTLDIYNRSPTDQQDDAMDKMGEVFE